MGKIHKRLDPWIFLLPPVLIFVSTVFIPIIWSITYSLYEWNGIDEMLFVGLANYKRMIADSTFITTLINNFIFAGINVVLQLGNGMLMAIIMMHITKGRELFKVLYFTPCVISTMAISQMFQKVLSRNPMGIINYMLGVVGLESLQRSFTSDMGTALIVISLVEAYKFSGLFMIIYYSAFMAIPDEIIEAATIDGAKWWQLYRYVRFPLIKDIFVITLVMVANGTLKAFEISYILTNGGPGYASELVATYMYKIAFNSMDYGYGSAIAVFLVVESLLVVSLIRKAFPISDNG